MIARTFFTILCLFQVTACAPTRIISPISEGYEEDTAIFVDSFDRVSRSVMDFYVLNMVENQPLINAATAAGSASYGSGPNVIARSYKRAVPAKPLKVSLLAYTYYGAPIVAMTSRHKPLSVKGEISFHPEPNQTYVVSGKLGESESFVWIEDSRGRIVSPKIKATVMNESGKGVSSMVFVEPSIEETQDKSQEELFVNINTGIDLSTVVSILGEPTSESEEKVDKTLEYNGLGKIRLTRGSEAQSWYVHQVIPKAITGGENLNEIDNQLNSSDPGTLRLIATQHYQEKTTDQGVLDNLAARVWENRNTDDKEMADAMAWFCKVLGASKNPRYNMVLRRLAVESEASKIRRHSKAQLKTLKPADKIEQFNPETP